MHTKVQGLQPLEDFFRFLPYMGMSGHLGHVTRPFEQTFIPPSLYKLHMKFDWLAKWFLRRRCLKSVDDDVQWEDYLSWASGSGELIIWK